MRTAITTIVFAVILLACGASARQQTIAASLTTTNAARDAFVVWDRSHQQSLVDTAANQADARERVDAYRKQRDPIVQGFAAVYRLLAIAATDDKASLADLIQAAALLHSTLKELGAIK